jgi:hypothetical protein
MSLQAAGDSARANLTQHRQPKSKVDDVIAALGEDGELLLSWLRDPDGWSSYMIQKSLESYSAQTATPGLTCGHSTIERWRTMNGIEFTK